MAEETTHRLRSGQETEEKDQSIPSWLLPVLTGLASMGGNYILWIKPLQDAFKAMSEEIEELRQEIKELKRERNPDSYRGREKRKT